MKTSKKILITVAGIFIAVLVTGLFVLRQDALTLFRSSQSKINYVEIPVENFENLDFSGNWIVQVRQSRTLKVEVALTDDIKPDIENIHKKLYFKTTTDSIRRINNPGEIRVKIAVPKLQSIKASGGTKIQLKSFQSDSLDITLEDNSSFTGDNNKVYYSSIKTSGKALLELIDNPND